MAVLEVNFDGNIDDLQDQLDDADLDAEVDVQGDAPAGQAQQDQDGGVVPGGRTAIVGAITALAGLLTPIKEILEGIRNFLLLTLAPVFTALRPLFEFLRDTLLQVSQFLAGDTSLSELISTLVDQLLGSLEGVVSTLASDIASAIKTAINNVVSTLNDNLSVVEIEKPFDLGGGDTGGTETDGSKVQSRTGRREGGQGQDSIETLARAGLGFSPAGILAQAGSEFLADRSDEAKKEAQANELEKFQKFQFGGDAGNTG